MAVTHRQVAVDIEILALLVAVRRAPDAGNFRLGIDCQELVTFFPKRRELPDDYRSVHADMWPRVDEAKDLRGPGLGVEVYRVKAHRVKEAVEDEAM